MVKHKGFMSIVGISPYLYIYYEKINLNCTYTSIIFLPYPVSKDKLRSKFWWLVNTSSGGYH